MDCRLKLHCGFPGADGGGGGGGVASGASILTMPNDEQIQNHHMSDQVSSSYPDDDDDDDGSGGLELGLGLGIGGGSKTKEEGFPSCSSSSSSSDNIPNSSIVGSKRAAVDSVSPQNATSVVGWPPIRRAHRNPIVARRIKPEHGEFSSKQVNSSRINGYLSVKVNMDGTLIGRKVDLKAHSSYDMLAQTLEDMFHGSLGSSRLLNGASEFLLTYEDKDGDCMLVGDVPWLMFLSSVKRLRILRNPKSKGPNNKS